MENMRKYLTIKLASTWENAKKFLSSAEFHSFTIFWKNLVAIEMLPTNIYLNKPH